MYRLHHGLYIQYDLCIIKMRYTGNIFSVAVLLILLVTYRLNLIGFNLVTIQLQLSDFSQISRSHFLIRPCLYFVNTRAYDPNSFIVKSVPLRTASMQTDVCALSYVLSRKQYIDMQCLNADIIYLFISSNYCSWCVITLLGSLNIAAIQLTSMQMLSKYS